MPSDYWNRQTAGFQQGANNLATALMRQPALQRQADEQLGRTMVMKSQYDLNNARGQELAQKGALVETLQKVAPQAQAAMLKGNFEDPTVQQFVGATAALTGQNKQDVWKAAKEGMGTMLALQGKTPMAAAVENPVSVQNNQVNADERTGRPMNITGTMMKPDGTVLGQAATTLAPGATRLSPVQGAGAPVVTGKGEPLPPHSSQVQGVLASTIAKIVANKDLDASDKNRMILTLKNQMDNLEPTGTAQPQAAPNPPPATTAATTSTVNAAGVLQQARDAIQRGADPQKVRERLQQMGINPTQL